MLDTPFITRTDPVRAAVIRFDIPRADIVHVMGPGMAEVLATAAAQGIGPAGRVYAHRPARPLRRLARRLGRDRLLMAWIEAQGLCKAPGLWEVYVSGPDLDPDPSTWRTELNQALTD